MPDAMKVIYIIFMWAGRLEFLAIYVLIGTVWLTVSKPFKRKAAKR